MTVATIPPLRKGLQVRRLQALSLAQPPGRNRHGMGQDRALRLGQGGRAEPYDLRSSAISSARIAAAISPGVAAPIFSPTGP